MQITVSLDAGPGAIAIAPALVSVAAVSYVALVNDLAPAETVQLSMIVCYGHLAAFIAGRRNPTGIRR